MVASIPARKLFTLFFAHIYPLPYDAGHLVPSVLSWYRLTVAVRVMRLDTPLGAYTAYNVRFRNVADWAMGAQ